ncbi:hypothetical protein [Sphingomonas sp.]|uniref:hypothetical protein n=1 Tax=Sphingomonas sp. TaxID=28214 RepID=UPI0035BBE49F
MIATLFTRLIAVRSHPAIVGMATFVTTLERFLTSLSRRGFPRAWFSDSRSLLVLEAGMDGTSIVGGSSG